MNTDEDRIWQSLKRLKRDEKLGAAAKLAFCELWHAAGGQPGHIVVSLRELARDLGRAPSSAADWLSTLKEEELIAEIGRDDRGMVQLYVFNPNPGGEKRVLPPDPQQRLPLTLAALEPPRHSRVSAGKPERKPDRVSAGKPESPPPKTLENTGKRPPTSRVSAGKPESRPHGTIEDHIKPYHDHRTLQSMDHGREAAGEPAHISAALLMAIEERTDPAALRAAKAELVEYITTAVGDPEMDPSIPRRAADAVIEYGFAQAELEHIVEATRRKRNNGTINSTPGAYFLFRIRKECKTRRIPWTEPTRKSELLTKGD